MRCGSGCSTTQTAALASCGSVPVTLPHQAAWRTTVMAVGYCRQVSQETPAACAHLNPSSLHAAIKRADASLCSSARCRTQAAYIIDPMEMQPSGRVGTSVVGVNLLTIE